MQRGARRFRTRCSDRGRSGNRRRPERRSERGYCRSVGRVVLDAGGPRDGGSDVQTEPDGSAGTDAALDGSTANDGSLAREGGAGLDAGAANDGSGEIDATLDGSGGEIDATLDGPTEANALPDAADTGSGGLSTSAFCGGCGAGFGMCSGLCVSTTDPSFGCGSCTPCALANAQVGCNQGACSILKCNPDWIDRDGNPANGCEVNVTSPSTCAGGGACPSVTPLCGPSGCLATCAAPLSECSGGACVNLSTDNGNCGTCGSSACAFGLQCVNGRCGATATCAAPELRCANGNGCVEPVAAPANCNVCELCGQPTATTTALCTNDSCEADCQPGWTSCYLPEMLPATDSPSYGCFTTQTDPANCGACGHACAVGQACIDSACVAASTLSLVTGLSKPNSLALDATRVFWSDTGTGTISSVAKTGGAVTTLAQNQVSPASVALDDTFVYWSAREADSGSTGFILRAPKDASAAPQIVTTADSPRSLVVVGSTVYFTSVNPNNGIGGISSVPKTGGVATTFASPFEDGYVELVTDGTTLYTELPEGGPIIPVAISIATAQTTQFGEITGGNNPIAVDATRVYYGSGLGYGTIDWFDLNDVDTSGMLSVPTTSPTPFPWASRAALALATSGCGIFWTETVNVYFDTFPPGGATPLYPVQVAAGVGSIGALAADATDVYWTDASGLIGKAPLP